MAKLKHCVIVIAVCCSVFMMAGGAVEGRASKLQVTATGWVGRVVAVVQDLSLSGSVLRVSVVGLKGLPVKVSTADGNWSVTGYSGSKPEFGEYMVEFAALARGDYLIEPQGLGVSLAFYSDTKSYITVEFTKSTAVTATTIPSATSVWPSLTPSPSPTLQPTRTATPLQTPVVPLATPTSTWTPPLRPTATQVLQTPTPTAVVTGESTQVTRVVWSGRVAYTTAGSPQSPCTIVVRVPGQVGLPVLLKLDGFQSEAVTGTKPEYGGFACEFGGLAPGAYEVEPQGINSSVTLTLAQGEFALVEFTPLTVAGAWPTGAVTPTLPLVSTGVVVVSTPVVQPPTLPLTTVVSTPTIVAQAGVRLVPADLVTPSFRVLRPSTKPVWTAQVTERVPGAENGPATLVVKVLGARDLPVWLKADGWQTSATTGTKPEYGDFACEFGGLPAGEYQIDPDGLGLTYTVKITPSEFVVVDFTYTAQEFQSIPALALPGDTLFGGEESWSGRVVSRTVEIDTPEEWGSILIEVLGLSSLPVEVRSADGWSAFKLTEARDGYAGFVSEFVRLSPGVYQVVPQGLGAWIELNVDAGSRTRLEFASQ